MADAEDDKRLLRGVAARDESALRELYARYAPTMLALGRRMLGPAGEADDVMSEVFFELWRRADRYDPRRGAVKTYLLLTMRSRCLDKLRSRAARGRERAVEFVGDGPADTPGPADRLEQSEESVRVRQALSCLSDDQRRAVEAAFYQGLSHRQIAQRDGEPLGTVKSRIRTGLIRLRQALRTTAEEGVTP